MFGLFTLDKDEGERESNQNQAHLERPEHFSKFGVYIPTRRDLCCWSVEWRTA